jgi:hypothetical protein
MKSERAIKLKSKRFFVFLLVAVVVLSMNILSVCALDAEFSAKADYTSLKAGDTFNVRVAVNNMQDSEGIVLVQFNLHFDSRYLKLNEWKSNKPQSWGEGFEEIAAIKTDEKNPDDIYLYCSYMYSEKESGKGINENDILYTDITFEVLSEEANGTVLRLDNTDIMDDSNKFVSCNELEMKIDFDGAKVTVIKNSDNTESKKFDYENALKIVIAVAAVLITVIASVYIGKYLKQKKA